MKGKRIMSKLEERRLDALMVDRLRTMSVQQELPSLMSIADRMEALSEKLRTTQRELGDITSTNKT